jgi:tripeptidyl-peptidase I
VRLSSCHSSIIPDKGNRFPSGRHQKVVLSAPIKAGAERDAPSSDASNGIPKSCATSVTPACVQAQYKMPTTLVTHSKSAIGVSGYENEYANEADLKTFMTTYRPDMSPNTTFQLQTLDGGDNNQWLQYAGLEAVSTAVRPERC